MYPSATSARPTVSWLTATPRSEARGEVVTGGVVGLVDPRDEGGTVVVGELARGAATVPDGFDRSGAPDLSLDLLDEGSADGEAVGDGLLGGVASERGVQDALSEDGWEGGHLGVSGAAGDYDQQQLTLVLRQAVVDG